MFIAASKNVSMLRTYEVECNACAALVRPCIMVPKGVRIAVGDPEPGIIHPCVDVICSGDSCVS